MKKWIRNYEPIRYSYREKVRLLILQGLHTWVASLSGVTPLVIDCCVKFCHAFTGDKTNLEACETCGEARYDTKGRARKVFEYLPLTPRFQAMFNNPELIHKMLYWHNYVQEDNQIDDIFDSRLYKRLCTSSIIIDGANTGTRFFSGKHDIATSLLTNGVQLFDQGIQQNSTCWPLMLQNLNLPPSERAQLRNLIPLGVIPGPNQPKDFDSFLIPFVEESKELARGVRTYNAQTSRHFTLRQHTIIVSGDMQAMKHMEQLKGPNSMVPCRDCEIEGVYSRERRSYYVPLTFPIYDASGEAKGYDPRNLPLRTKSKMAKQTQHIENASAGDCKELTKKYGISGPSILNQIPSINRPTSYPHEFMHLFLISHGPGLVSLWTYSYSGISGPGSGDYLISTADWAQIGHETEEIGPIVLRGRLPGKYYDHYLKLVSILKCLLELSNTTHRIEDLKIQAIEHVERPEEQVTACALSKVVPYSTINKHVFQMAQMSAISAKFPAIRKALLFGRNDNPVNLNRMERIYPEYPDTIPQFPCLQQFLLQLPVRRRLAAFFQTNNPERTFHEWLAFIPERCKRWGKLRISDNANCIRSVSARDSFSPYGQRDASFVRYVYSKDENEDYPDKPIKMVTATAYGRLDYILALTLPESEDFNIPKSRLYILAHIMEAKGTSGDAADTLVSFRQMGRSFVVNVRAIENVVGRVETKGVILSGEWVIVDRSNNACQTSFNEVDPSC
ncbi:hypothetical protein CTheo_7136 [Ceratobasidium theobromae]|uniref:Transposase family Tnp2 protein n=1 Tax=Ceratobasidium theobromae TaxID=1582974 RepID=A0A5N5QCE7_9AGAM|nr:hypothetical protein CTheo_7136 [Ceratobasidium theobromae]